VKTPRRFCSWLSQIWGLDHEAYVSGRLRLLSMPDSVMTMVSSGSLPLSIVPILSRLPTGEDQIQFATEAVRHKLNDSEVSANVRQFIREPVRQRKSRQMTLVKLEAVLNTMTNSLQTVPRKLDLSRLNRKERVSLISGLSRLIKQAESLKTTLDSSDTNFLTNVGPDNLINAGEEWTISEIEQINAVDRPTDTQLSLKLKRTVGAIRAMRSKTSEKQSG
jgi:glutamyl/glutaminyl-tRNA synthetase